MKTTLAVIALVSTANSVANVTRFGHKEQVYRNNNCELNSTCDLKEFALNTYEYVVQLKEGKSWGTGSFFSYKTDKVENLENYGVVNFIKGCHFESYKDGNEIVKEFNWKREFFGDYVTYRHPKMVIDSIDTDPMYNNGPQEHRHAYMRWNKVPGSFSEDTEEYFFREVPTESRLYASDLPGTAFTYKIFNRVYAKNISLEFKTCLYKIVDIPELATPGDLQNAQSISCLEWSSSYVFDHDKMRFETRGGIDPACLD